MKDVEQKCREDNDILACRDVNREYNANRGYLRSKGNFRSETSCEGRIKGQVMNSPEVVFEESCSPAEQEVIKEEVESNEELFNPKARNSGKKIVETKEKLDKASDVAGAGLIVAGATLQNPSLTSQGAKMILPI